MAVVAQVLLGMTLLAGLSRRAGSRLRMDLQPVSWVWHLHLMAIVAELRRVTHVAVVNVLFGHRGVLSGHGLDQAWIRRRQPAAAAMVGRHQRETRRMAGGTSTGCLGVWLLIVALEARLHGRNHDLVGLVRSRSVAVLALHSLIQVAAVTEVGGQ